MLKDRVRKLESMAAARASKEALAGNPLEVLRQEVDRCSRALGDCPGAIGGCPDVDDCPYKGEHAACPTVLSIQREIEEWDAQNANKYSGNPLEILRQQLTEIRRRCDAEIGVARK
jgi:hypothetical protein